MIKVNGMQGVVIMAVFRQWDNLNEKLIIVFLHLLRTEELGESIMQRVTYSLKVLLAEFEKLLFLILLFGILDCLLEFFIVFWTIIPIRIFMGGSHRKTMLGCLFQSIIMFSIVILLSKNYEMGMGLYLVTYVVLVIEIWISTPIQSACRITYSKQQRMKFKAKALTVLLIISWTDKLLPGIYQNQVRFALLFQAVEIIISCINKTKGAKL